MPANAWLSLPEIIEQPIGVGPYRLKSWQKGVAMVFEKNLYYWRGAPTLHVMQDLQTTAAPAVTIYKIASATWEHMDMNLQLYRQAVARQVPASGGVLATAGGISVTVPHGATASGADFVLNDIAAPTQKFSDARSLYAPSPSRPLAVRASPSRT